MSYLNVDVYTMWFFIKASGECVDFSKNILDTVDFSQSQLTQSNFREYQIRNSNFDNYPIPNPAITEGGVVAATTKPAGANETR